MDIIAHALWTTAAATALRQSLQRPVRLGWAAFWGVFPDVVSFSIPAEMRIWWWLTGASKTLLPQANGPHFEWVWSVYNCSHSVLVFAVVFGLAWLLMRRLPLEILGWLLHIVIDIFTHRGLFALRFLWPVPDRDRARFVVYGFRRAEPAHYVRGQADARARADAGHRACEPRLQG